MKRNTPISNLDYKKPPKLPTVDEITRESDTLKALLKQQISSSTPSLNQQISSPYHHQINRFLLPHLRSSLHSVLRSSSLHSVLLSDILDAVQNRILFPLQVKILFTKLLGSKIKDISIQFGINSIGTI